MISDKERIALLEFQVEEQQKQIKKIHEDLDNKTNQMIEITDIIKILIKKIP